jgi:hypothetical protein
LQSLPKLDKTWLNAIFQTDGFRQFGVDAGRARDFGLPQALFHSLFRALRFAEMSFGKSLKDLLQLFWS